MDQLAVISFTDTSGKNWTVKAADVRRVSETLDGSLVMFYDGFSVATTSKPSVFKTDIDALWDQYVTRGGSTAAYTPTNVTTDRAYDADTVVVAELADVVGTLIADLQALGLVS